jgi:photosystem II stability/assembly factor-like uncharacterized protein
MKHIFTITCLFLQLSAFCQWQKGNSPSGGTVKYLAKSDKYVIAGCSGNESGVFVSPDFGRSWKKVVKTDKPSYQIPDVTVNGIVKGTSDEVFYVASDGEGIYKLFKNAGTWELKNIGFRSGSKTVQSVVFYKNKIFATVYNTGIYTTSDEGTNWIASGTGIPNEKYIKDIVVCGDTLFAGGDGGLFYSKNSGSSWTSFSPELDGKYVIHISLTKDHICLGVFNEGTYILSKSGAIITRPSDITTYSHLIPFAIYDNKIYGGYNYQGIFYSELPNINWQPTSSCPENKHPLCGLAVKDTFLIGTGGFGVYRSSDKAQTWTESSKGMSAFKYTSIKTIGNVILASTNINGIYASYNNGQTWKRINNNLGGNAYITDMLVKDSLIFLATNAIFMSSDTGKSWKQIPDVFGTQLATNGKTIFSAWLYGGIKSTRNNGSTWEDVNFSHTDQLIYDIAAKDSMLLIGTHHGGAYFSANLGKTWKEVNTGLENLAVHGVLIKDTMFFITTGCKISSCDNIGVYRSSNKGEKWEKKNIGLCCIPTELILRDSIIFGAFPQTVIYSTNNGDSWNSVSNLTSGTLKSSNSDNGIKKQTIWSNRAYVFAGTDNGFYYHPISSLFSPASVSSKQLNEKSRLLNYPNPFNETTKIQYTIEKGEQDISLMVYDNQGKVISHINEKNKPSGTYNLVFESSQLTPGVYFCKLKSNKATTVIKLIVVR